MRLEDIKDYFVLRTMVENPLEIVRFRKEKNRKKDLLVQFRDGRKLRLKGGSDNRHVFQRIYLRDEYRLNDLAAMSLSCVVDLGANVGFFSSRIAAFSQKVICYEPVTDNFNQLKDNLKDLTNVYPVRKAVAGSSGTIRLYSPQYDGATGRYSILEKSDGNIENAYEEVPCITLDQLFEEHEINRCDLLKIDVEGAEYDILGAANDQTFSRIDRIYGEYHHPLPGDPVRNIESLSALLRKQAFRVEIIPNKKAKDYGLFFAVKGHLISVSE